MTIVITGGRDFADRERVFLALDKVHAATPVSLLVHGDASGADALAGEWAKARGVACTPQPADWKRYGRGAGPARNQAMLVEFNPQLLVAFPGGKGTADMIRRAEKAGVPVEQA